MNISEKNSAIGAKRFLWDVSGAFGDIGVLFPLAVALIAKNGFNPTALFLMAGLFYIASAWHFKITMPVQPLKAMSAIAIAAGLGAGVVNAAGIVMGVILFFIAFTGLSVRLGNIFPVSVIRGIQLGLGMLLVKTAIPLMNKDLAIALAAGVVLITCLFLIRKIPPLLPVLILGAVISLRNLHLSSIGYVPLTPKLPDMDSIMKGSLMLVLPQLALTFGNAIVATEATGKILYGERAKNLTLRNVPLSMAIANIVSGITGGAPMCHGCGGLTAHCKFGATSERSGYIIGSVLIVLALFFGRSALSIVSAFPIAILGVLLCAVGIQHALFVTDIAKDKISLAIALIVAVLGFYTNNLTIGFAAGLAMHYSLTGYTKMRKYLLAH